MHYLKKSLSVLLAAALVAGTISGCSELSTDDDGYVSEKKEKSKKSTTVGDEEEDKEKESATGGGESKDKEKEHETDRSTSDNTDIEAPTDDESGEMSGVEIYVKLCSEAENDCDGCAYAAEFALAALSLSTKLSMVDTSWIEDRSSTTSGIFTLMNDKLLQVQDKFYELMDHDCSAPEYYVENIPWVFEKYEGYYSGYWKGLGPCGQGTFSGVKMYHSEVDQYSRAFTSTYEYSGDWRCGAPDGYGEYRYILVPNENAEGIMARKHYEEFYSGYMKAGKKDGYGIMVSLFDGDSRSTGTKISYFGEGYYEEGKLVGTVDFCEYDDEGLFAAGTAIWGGDVGWDGYGSLIPNNFTSRREWTEKQRQEMLAVVGGVALAGMAVYIGLSIPTTINGMDVDDWIAKHAEESRRSQDEYLARAAEQAKQEEERRAMEEETIKTYQHLYYYEMDRGDPYGNAKYYEAWGW